MEKILEKNAEVKNTDKPRVLYFFNNWAYIFWFLFYVSLLSVLTGGYAVLLYMVSLFIAFTTFAEDLWRKVSGVRPLRLRGEKERLAPLFMEVYKEACKNNPDLPKHIKLYIQENMDINAYAFGASTLVLTRGSIELLDDNGLKGLIAHELGHFYHYDTQIALITSVANFYFSALMSILERFKNKNDARERSSVVAWVVDIIYGVFSIVRFISEILTMNTSRENEYRADNFARRCGYGKELANVLTEIYQVSFTKPQSIKEQLKASHPPITMRIEKLEKAIY